MEEIRREEDQFETVLNIEQKKGTNLSGIGLQTAQSVVQLTHDGLIHLGNSKRKVGAPSFRFCLNMPLLP